MPRKGSTEGTPDQGAEVVVLAPKKTRPKRDNYDASSEILAELTHESREAFNARFADQMVEIDGVHSNSKICDFIAAHIGSADTPETMQLLGRAIDFYIEGFLDKKSFSVISESDSLKLLIDFISLAELDQLPEPDGADNTDIIPLMTPTNTKPALIADLLSRRLKREKRDPAEARVENMAYAQIINLLSSAIATHRDDSKKVDPAERTFRIARFVRDVLIVDVDNQMFIPANAALNQRSGFSGMKFYNTSHKLLFASIVGTGLKISKLGVTYDEVLQGLFSDLEEEDFIRIFKSYVNLILEEIEKGTSPLHVLTAMHKVTCALLDKFMNTPSPGQIVAKTKTRSQAELPDKPASNQTAMGQLITTIFKETLKECTDTVSMLNDSETFEGIDWNAVRAMFGVSEQVGTKESVDTEARIRKLAYNTAKIALHSKIRMATRRIKHIIANGRVY